MKLQPINESAWVIENFLSSQECLELIGWAEETGFAPADVRTHTGQQALPHVRNNQRAVVELPRWVEVLWKRLGKLELPQINGKSAAGLPRALRFYKYTPGQRFRMHKDGPWQENGMTSELTLLVYLNEGAIGGATVFKDAQVRPKVGMALLFLHPTWHEGASVEAGVKYVVRSDVLYR